MTLDDFRKRVVLVDDIEGEPGTATQSNVRRLIEARMSSPRVGPVVFMCSSRAEQADADRAELDLARRAALEEPR